MMCFSDLGNEPSIKCRLLSEKPASWVAFFRKFKMDLRTAARCGQDERGREKELRLVNLEEER